MLRPQLHPYFKIDAERLRKKYGDFILINTNFSNVNAFVSSLNLFLPANKTGEEPKFGRGAVGMSREYAEGLRDFKQAVFEDIKNTIPVLEKAFPKINIVVRPHPTENPQVYRDIAAQCERVFVTNEGNVIPWLMATKVLVHNSCTTGVEAYIMKVPAVTYMASRNEYYDNGYYRLPNTLSYRCLDLKQLQETLEMILKGKLGAPDGDERRDLMNYYLAAQDGPLACERIVDTLDKIAEGWSQLLRPPYHHRLAGRYRANWRRLVKAYKSHMPNSKYRPEFQRHRYPGLTLQELKGRISKIQTLLGDTTELEAEQISDYIFRISAF